VQPVKPALEITPMAAVFSIHCLGVAQNCSTPTGNGSFISIPTGHGDFFRKNCRKKQNASFAPVPFSLKLCYLSHYYRDIWCSIS
jgi:hypothetical protein